MSTVTRYSVISPSATMAWLEMTSTPVMPLIVDDAWSTATRTASENDLSDEPTSWITLATLATSTSLFGHLAARSIPSARSSANAAASSSYERTRAAWSWQIVRTISSSVP